MKKMRLFLLLLMALMLPLAMQAQVNIPFSYGFEDNDLSATRWHTENFSASNAGELGIYNLGSEAYAGSYVFRFSSYTRDNDSYDQYLISPELNAPSGVIVQFYYKVSSPYGTEKFRVGYSTTDSAVSSFIFGPEVSTSTTTWTPSEEYSFPAGTKYVAIYYYANYQYRLYVDEVAFTAPPACPSPTGLMASDITPNSATLTWDAGNATGWVVEYDTASDFANAISVNVTGTPTTSISPLIENTTYYFRVQGDCGEEISEWSSTQSFRTRCNPTPVAGYEEDFNRFTATNSTYTRDGILPDCWDAIYLGESAGYDPHIYNGTYTPTAGNNALILTAGNGYSTTCGLAAYAIMPEFDDLSGKQLNFATAMESASYGELSVGYVTDLDENTFSLIETVPSNYYGGADRYRTHEVIVDGVPAGARLAFKWEVTYSDYYYCTVDDIAIVNIPTCLRPSDVELVEGSVTDTSATISWTDNTANPVSYILLVNDEEVEADANPFTLTDLTPNTEYTVRVKAVCTETDTSYWSNTSVNFYTECAAVTITETERWSENFDSYETYSFPRCWQRLEGYSSYPSIYNYYAHSGSNIMYFYIYGTSYTNLIATPEFTNDINTLQVSFYARYSSTNPTFVVGVLDDSTFEAVDTITLTNSYDEYTVMFNNYVGNGNRIAFKAVPSGTSSYSSYYVHFDDITVELIPSCIKPSDVTVVNSTITSSEATIGWTDHNAIAPANGWTLLVNGTEELADTNPFTLTGLTAATTYTVKVKANCADDDASSWSRDSITFITDCDIIEVTAENPFREHFSNNGLCWIPNEYVSGNTDWQIVSTITDGGSLYSLFDGPCAKFYSNSSSAQVTKAVSPWFDLSTLENPRLTFQMANPAYSSSYPDDINKLIIYYRDAQGAEWVQLDSIGDAHGEWTLMNYSLPNTSATYQLAFEGTNNNGSYGRAIFVDEVIVEETPTCMAPSDLTLDTVTTTYFQVSWTDNNENAPESWTVAYSIDGGETFTEVAGIDHDSAVVVNFDAPLGDANVIAKVRANCETENASYWCDEISFVTPPTCPAPTDLEYTSVTSTSATLSWTAGGEETQWIFEVNGVESDIVNENPFTIDTLTAETDYTFRVRAYCAANDSSLWSNMVSVYTGMCTPAPQYVDNQGITNVTFGLTQVVNNNTHPTEAPFYADYTAMAGDGAAATNVTVDVTLSTYYSYGTVIWVNWNNDLVFTDDEVVYTGESATSGSYSSPIPYTLHCNFTIPMETPLGNYRMRIGAADTQFDDAIDNGYGYDPCLSENWVIYEDYTLTVTEAPSCLAPSDVTVSDITAHGATIGWTDNNETAPESWTINLNGTDTIVNENPFVFDNLLPSTNYIVMVRANCSATDSSFWSLTASLHTPCDIVPAENYSEDFADYTANASVTTSGVMPDCWDYLYSGVDAGAEPHVYNGTSAVTSGDNCLTITAGGYEDWWYDEYYDYGTTNYAIMPEFDDLTGKQLNFAYKTGTYGSLAIGYMTDVTDAGSFVEIESIPSTTTATNYEVNVDNVPAGVRLAFAWTYDSEEYDYSCYIDDMTITDLPNCRKPTALSVTNITSNTATLDWTDNNESAPDSWTISLNGVDTVVTEHPVVLNHLTADTDYDVMVKANCDAIDSSDWSNATAFATLCDVILVTEEEPYHEGFETYGDFGCWSSEIIAGTYNWAHSSSYAAEGSYSIYFSYYGDEARMTSPMFDLTELTAPQLTFQHRQYESGYYPADHLFVYYRTAPSEEWTELASYTSAYNVMTEETISLPDASATYQICFVGHSANGSSVYLDDVNILETPTCFAPTDITFTDITDTSVTIGWTDNNEVAPENGWTINLNGVDTVVTTNPFTFDNLTSTTLYTVKVKANCADDDESAWSEEEQFSTNCDVMTANGYSEDFSNYTATSTSSSFSVLPLCWRDIFSGTAQEYRPHVYNGSYAVNLGDNALLIVAGSTNYGAVNYAIMPEFDDVNDLIFSFSYRMESSSYGSLTFGYLTDFSDANTFTPIDNMTSTETANNYETTLTNIPAGARLAFKWQVSSSYYDWGCTIDDINIHELIAQPCDTPTNVSVNDGVITWTGNADNYHVQISVAGEVVIDTTVNTASYTIDGLNEGDHASVTIQGICDEDNLSEWSEAVEFDYTTGLNEYRIAASIFPNPTTGHVTVVCNDINAEIAVYDMFGKLVMTSKVVSERTELNFSDFAPGVYMVRIADNTRATHIKVVKK